MDRSADVVIDLTPGAREAEPEPDEVPVAISGRAGAGPSPDLTSQN